ncbi:uncharacterized protein LOC143258431 [Tachypleus tridentatus]|uniref:uncharacterized protein LOC143258431 n=1 Tax=Tachypleus tridentatus TaxID=6853 RepID=UPI003FD5BF35
MCGKGLYFLDDFIIPSLDSKRFPCLSWIDRDEKLYKVKWLHKGSRTWRENDFDIFSEWDRMKGHHNPQIPGYWTLAKQRFRNAHSKLEKIGRVKRDKLKESKGFRVYRITGSFDPLPQQTYCNSPDLLTKDSESDVYVNILSTFQHGELYFACQDGIFPVKLESTEIVIDTGMISTEILEDSHIQNSDGLMKEECLEKNEFGDVDCDLVMPTGYEDVLCDPVLPTGYDDVDCDPVVPTRYDVDCDPVVPTRYEDVCDPVLPTKYEVDFNTKYINPNLIFQTSEPNIVQQSNCKDDVLDIDSETLSFYNFMNDERENWQLSLDLGSLGDILDTENMMEVFGDLKTMAMNEK